MAAFVAKAKEAYAHRPYWNWTQRLLPYRGRDLEFRS